MLLSLSLIFLVGMSAAAVCKKLKLPGLIGMLITGIVLGISSELRQIALIIILTRAGLSLNISDLKKVGRPALLMSFVPACFEILGYVLLAPALLGLSRIEAAVTGAVLGAVSPAVVVPRTIKLTEEGYGVDKSIPQMIMAGASCDDIFVIVLFSAFVGMAQGEGVSLLSFTDIPVSIVLGIAAGAVFGFALYFLFEKAFAHGHMIRNSVKVIVILGAAFLLMTAEKLLDGYVAMSGLLAVIGMACVLGMKCPDGVTDRLSQKFGKLWIAAEVVLFVMVGAAVDIRYALTEGFGAVIMIFCALVFRAAGVLLCLIKTPLSFKERLFCVIAYMPKATVQAAIGSVPLSMGLPCGNTVLCTAVLAILITAPLGAFGMDMTYRRLLTKEPE